MIKPMFSVMVDWVGVSNASRPALYSSLLDVFVDFPGMDHKDMHADPGGSGWACGVCLTEDYAESFQEAVQAAVQLHGGTVVESE